jgi:proline dehydrogenase
VFKVTAFASTPLLTKVSLNQELTSSEKREWMTVSERFDSLISLSAQLKHPIMVDAEESWIQPAIDSLTLEAMRKYNIDEVIVLNTYQMYKKDSLSTLKSHHQIALEDGFKIGAKIVRGAYMEKERAKAIANNYQSPIQNNKDDSDKDYNAAIQYVIEHISTIMTVCGTHNEDSNMLAVNLLIANEIEPSNPHFWFSQLLGMCDFISFNLGAADYNVAKYVPYGPVASVTPYLIRRADENSSVAGQAIKELEYLRKEIKNRK